ncbi:hypothetical protein B0H11DRAFT_2286662 [Mycena galericulata]|nr:hypothetical protein B0H11DRAFT_2286662 [Mycena galericulata]
MAALQTSDFLSLTEFIHKAETEVLTGDDALFESALAKYWAPQVQEEDVATSAHLTRDAFSQFLITMRRAISDRTAVSETYVIATPRDPTEKTGAVGYTHVLTGVQGGVKVTATIVAVMRINWVENKVEAEGGHREIVTESFVVNIS